MNILTIAGSPSPVSRSGALLMFAEDLLRRQGGNISQVSVVDLPPKDLMPANFRDTLLHPILVKLESARAVVIATPVYRSSFSGLLKIFFDLLPERALAGKVVLPLATIGNPSHMLAVEYVLKPALSALGAKCILNGVHAFDRQIAWGVDGELLIDDDIAVRLKDGVKQLIDSISKETQNRSPAATSAVLSFASSRCRI